MTAWGDRFYAQLFLIDMRAYRSLKSSFGLPDNIYISRFDSRQITTSRRIWAVGWSGKFASSKDLRWRSSLGADCWLDGLRGHKCAGDERLEFTVSAEIACLHFIGGGVLRHWSDARFWYKILFTSVFCFLRWRQSREQAKKKHDQRGAAERIARVNHSVNPLRRGGLAIVDTTTAQAGGSDSDGPIATG